MDQKYVVLDTHDEPCGSVDMAICADYTALDKVMRFSSLENDARYHQFSDPVSFGFKYFEKQLPRRDIYPVAVLLEMEIDYEKRRRGHGAMALRGFRAVAADHNARLGLLRIGTFGGEEYETGMCWRKDFYSKYGWVAFNTPPVPGLILVWMYHPFPSLSDEERLMRGRLSKATPDKNELALVEGQG